MPLAQLPGRCAVAGRLEAPFLTGGGLVDDLNMRQGIVSGRVALLPRSTEIQPRVTRIRPSPFHSHSHHQARTRYDGQIYHEQAIMKMRGSQGKITQVRRECKCLGLRT